LTSLTFPDGTVLPLAPDLNAGTVALQYHFSRRLDYQDWLAALDPDLGFMALYESMFGDPWERDRKVGALIPGSLDPPGFTLPFEAGYLWSFTGGPHSAWEQESSYAALDFSPAMGTPGCAMSSFWAVAVAPGRIVRSDMGYVVLDLDGDGLEQTGWNVVYLHLDPQGRIGAGALVEAGDHLGHPSCEGGLSTGTHLHIARKFNGEWIPADSSIPFILSGWTPHNGEISYQGSLTKGGQTVVSDFYGTARTLIFKPGNGNKTP
jgi:LasA protease